MVKIETAHIIHCRALDTTGARAKNVAAGQDALRASLGIDLRVFPGFAGRANGIFSKNKDAKGTFRPFLGQGQMGLLLGHLTLYRLISEIRGYHLIMESDATFNPALSSLLDDMPTDFDILYLDYQCTKEFDAGQPVSYTPKWHRCFTPLRTHAYIISNVFAHKILHLNYEIHAPIDWWLAGHLGSAGHFYMDVTKTFVMTSDQDRRHKREIKWLCMRPSPFGWVDLGSDIIVGGKRI